MMTAVRAAFDYRDFRSRPPIVPAPAPAGAKARWIAAPATRRRARRVRESGAVRRLRHARVAASHRRERGSGGSRRARPGLSGRAEDRDARHPAQVRCRRRQTRTLSDVAAVRAAYDDLARRLGPRVLVMPMAGKGVELAFGALDDPQFGPARHGRRRRRPRSRSWPTAALPWRHSMRLSARRLLDGLKAAAAARRPPRPAGREYRCRGRSPRALLRSRRGPRRPVSGDRRQSRAVRAERLRRARCAGGGRPHGDAPAKTV